MSRWYFPSKFLSILLLLIFFVLSFGVTTTVPAQSVENQKLYVFFVQNTNYKDEFSNLSGTQYEKCVDNLYKALTEFARAGKGDVKLCKDTTQASSKFGEFVLEHCTEIKPSTTILIVLNGHGAQYGEGKPTYVFRNITEGASYDYEPLEAFLDAYKQNISPESTISEDEKANLIFWVLTCRETIPKPACVSTYKVARNEFNYNVLYACGAGGKVDVGRSVAEGGSTPILQALTEGMEGAADVDGNYDGKVTFGEIHKYAKKRNETLLARHRETAENSNVEIFRYGASDSTLSTLRKEFYAPQNVDYRVDHHDEHFEGRYISLSDENGAPFPNDLPSEYRYDARFKGRDFGSGNYTGVFFRGLDMSGAKFSSRKLYGAYFDHCNLRGATCGGSPLSYLSVQEKEGFYVEDCTF